MEMTIYSQNYVTKEVKAYQKQLGKAVNVNLNDLKGVKSLEVVTFEGYKNVLGDFSPLLIVKDIEGNFYNVHMEDAQCRRSRHVWRRYHSICHMEGLQMGKYSCQCQLFPPVRA